MTRRFRKLSDDRRSWYDMIPEGRKPANIKWFEGFLSYNWVDRPSVKSWQEFYDTAVEVLWQERDELCDPTRYVQYCIARANILGDEAACEVRRILHDHVMTHEFVVVYTPHGDLTYENVLEGPVFIDPGYSRGLPCRELDEAKILQSVLGWETARRGWKASPQVNPPWATNVHWALCLTHLIRLLHHPHPWRAHQWAIAQINALIQLL